jgi:hypothetical protein
MDKRLVMRLRGWRQADTWFLVLRDQDSASCFDVKQHLAGKAVSAGKKNKTLVRIACHELESFYLGDLYAVEQGLRIAHLSTKQGKTKYRDPDNRLSNAAQELARLTNNMYQKVHGSRNIAPFLRLDGSNASQSFNTLLAGIQKIIVSMQTQSIL